MKKLKSIVFGLVLSTMPVCCQTLDSFNPNVGSLLGGGSVSTVAVQPDGKILLAGSFGLVGGLNRNDLARVNADGSLDPSFNPGSYGAVGALAVQADGKIVVGGAFTAMGGQSHTNLARLNPDGSVDTSFNANASSSVFAIALQDDGRILVGGAFTSLAGQSCARIGRLNPDGSLDTNFNASANNSIFTIALQTNGDVLAGGTFTNLNGTTVYRIGRLNTDGSLDTTFNAGASNTVYSITVQPDNLILVGGSFTNITGAARNRIARLNNDGSVDPSFNPGASNTVYSIALQANGKMLVGGAFTGLAETVRNYLGRLNTDGTLDASFNPVASNYVYVVALQKDGKVLVGGTFTNLAGGQRNSVGRLNNNDATTDSVVNTSSFVTWMRGGSSPEIWRTSFDISTNGMDWAYTGDGARISGGWQLNGVTIPANATLRANGFIMGGGTLSGFSSLLQSYGGAPCIVTQPICQKNVAGSNITFSVVAGGDSPLNYQWQKNGTNLANGVNISGATNASLFVSNLAGTNAGNYSVVVSNASGSVTSSVASLSVVSAVTNDNFNPGLPSVYSTACQLDGKIAIGGNFSKTVGAQYYYGMLRANSDGTIDLSFANPSVRPGFVDLDADGRMVVGGTFTILAGQSHPYLGRLNTDGTLDASFIASANGTVYSAMQQPDGKIIVVGTFTQIAGQTANGIARLNSDGTLDGNFNAATTNLIYCVALQTNGQIIIGGSFTNVGGSVHNRIARLNPDGSLDTSFNPSIEHYFVENPDNPVYCLAVQPDGRILAGGHFFLAEGGLTKPWLIRLNSDGTLDTTFNATPNDAVYSVALQVDGKIFIGGNFTLVNGTTQNYFARLNSDGTLDSTYAASAGSTVYSTAIQPDGRVLVGGNFTTLYDSKSGYTRIGLGRLSNTEPGAHNLVFDGSTITWLRGGTSPELAWVVFDASNDGVNWSVLGTGIHTANGWQLTGVPIIVTNCIRVRGYVSSGEYNGSGWYAQDTLITASNNPPTILINDNDLGFTTRTTNRFGFDIAALVGQTVMVESSTNLESWTPILTNAVNYSPFYFFDSSTASYQSKFYRVRLP